MKKYIMIASLLFSTSALANDSKYPMCADKTTWFEKTWCETVEFQKQGWQDGKQDLANTKVAFQNLPSNTVKFVKETPSNVGNFVKNTGNGISNWASKEWNDIKEYQKKTWSK